MSIRFWWLSAAVLINQDGNPRGELRYLEPVARELQDRTHQELFFSLAPGCSNKTISEVSDLTDAYEEGDTVQVLGKDKAELGSASFQNEQGHR